MAVIGGICGTCQQDRFEHCVNQTTIRTAGVAGGIAGYIEHVVGAHECYFRYCDNLGDFSGVCAGGISGFGGSYLPARYERGGRTGTNINYCRNRGAITSAYIGGGLAGVCDAFVVTNSENYGTVSSTALSEISSYPASHYETLMLASERSIGGLVGACLPIGRKTSSYYDPICTLFNCANHTSALLTPDNADAGGLIGLITTKYSAIDNLWLTLNMQNCYQASSIKALASTSTSGFTPASGSLISDCTVTSATLEYCYAVQSAPESAGKTYHYKAIPYIQKNGQTAYGNATTIRRATARLMAPTFRVSRRQTASGRRFLQIRLRKYQGKYADIYIRNNRGKYLRLRLKNNNIRQQKRTFRLQYSFRKATLSIRIRTYKQKKRTKGSFYSRAKVVRIRE